jgi:hypothetical protein
MNATLWALHGCREKGEKKEAQKIIQGRRQAGETRGASKMKAR